VSNTSVVLTVWLAQRGASTRSGLDTFKTWTDAIGTIITSLAVIVGGIWAYFKFAKGRILRPKLAIEISGQWLKINRKQWLQVRIRVENIGASKVILRQEGTGLEVKVLAASQPSPPDYAEWKSADMYEVLDSHEWIEPGETVSDDLMLNLGIRPVPIRLDARLIMQRKIFKNIEINARRVLPVDAVISPQE
jgi:hypothetical protein